MALHKYTSFLFSFSINGSCRYIACVTKMWTSQ